ncbi:MAG: hypothetical protein KA123_01285 [Candidatus Eisenbacteria bacterium]|nr:hypothetical protein [Candidatus Eisenbacteria bacterium]
MEQSVPTQSVPISVPTLVPVPLTNVHPGVLSMHELTPVRAVAAIVGGSGC